MDLSVGAFGGEVADLHRGLASRGLEVPASEVKRAFFGPATLQAVRALQEQHALTPTGVADERTRGVIVAVAPHATIGDTIAIGGVATHGAADAGPAIAAGATRNAAGIVATELGVAAAGLRVEVWDRNAAGATLLAASATEADGRYSIDYDPALLKGKDRADLEIRVLDPKSEELARSAVEYQAGASAVSAVVVDGAKVQRAPEYARLGTALAPLEIGVQAPGQLDADGVTYLAERSGWDARVVGMRAQAATLSASTGIPAEHYYALLRAGAPATTEELSLVPDDEVANALKLAVQDGVISGDHAIDETVRLHRDAALRVLNEVRAPGAVSTLGEMVGLRLDAPAQARFLDVYRSVTGDPDALWDKLPGAGFDSQTIAALQTDADLGQLTLQNAPVVQRLVQAEGIASLDDLATAGFHDPARWNAVVAEHVPEGITAEAYASGLAAQVKLSAPTLVTADLVRREVMKVDGSGAEVSAFLVASHANHTIGAEPVKTWTGFGDLSETARSSVQRVERLYQLSPSDDSMVALSRLGIDSAAQIARYSKDAFVERFGAQLPSVAEALEVHEKASEIHSTALNLATMYLADRASPNLFAISGQATKTASAENPDVVMAATLENLFKNMDYCACEHCNSVFSPAAYFVELLELLDLGDTKPALRNPIEVLLERRPDLQHLLLSCENTNVSLPYLDIVNEVLEHYAVNGNLTTFTGHDVGPDVTTAELLADPQFVQDAAYDITKAEVYPWSLPFDMPLASMRLLFEVWDTTLADALETFGDAAGARRERLGLGDVEYRILTDSALRTLPEYFGEPAGTTIDALNAAIANAKTFCRRMDIAYEDLAAILKTSFVNPGGVIVLADVGSVPVECDFAQVELRLALPEPEDTRLMEIAYIRLHRFIRLWRALGGSVAHTDNLVTAFETTAPADFDAASVDAAFVALLDRIANYRGLLAALGVSPGRSSDWLGLWDPTLTPDDRRDRLARLLRVGLTDLTQLIEITGIDPFAGDLGGDDPSVLRFVRAWQAIKGSPLKLADLDFLLRDEDAGNLTPADDETLRDLKALRDALGAVESDIGLAVANPDLNAASAKLALVYDPATVDRFLALVSHTATYAAPFVSAQETLPAALVRASPLLDLDAFADRLTFTSLMSATTQAALNAAADALTLADVSEVTTQPELVDFVASFKTAVHALRDAGTADLAAFATEHPELAAIVSAVEGLTDPTAKAKAILDGILPELRSTLKDGALRTGLAAITKADAAVVDAIAAGPAVLHAAGDPAAGVLADFRALEDDVVLDAAGTTRVLVDPIASGEHILYVAAPPGTTVALELDAVAVIPATVVGAGGEVRSTVPIVLQTGILRRLAVTLTALPAGATARLSWRTKTVAKAAVPASRMYAQERVDVARASLLRVRKAALLQRALGLTPAEIAQLAGVDPGTKGFLDALDVDGSIAAPALHAQWERVERLLWFTRLKADHETDADALLAVLHDPGRMSARGKLDLGVLMEWDESSLTAVLAHHALALADLGVLDNLRIVVRTMDYVGPTLQPAADLIAWAVANPDGALVRSAKAALRARMTSAAWQASIQSVNDALRNQRRDALVAYILFHRPPSADITTPDRLYEHFLLDVQMDACLLTSRIVLATSTVQLFINRCLMALEPSVSPGSIRADHWKWMQRYRLWEANRRVFVHCENWLVPELRDGKSSFFSELESELLKADITDELAEDAYLAYLKKLDDVARLDIVAVYLDERVPGKPYEDVLHVFARTNGTTRQHYARRFEGGSWTPWEKVALNIEGDLLVPVVWRGQLFVFWTTVVTSGKGSAGAAPEKMAKEPAGSNLQESAEITLSWGEYFNGRWSSPKSTEMRDPIRIGGKYDPSILQITARTERPDPKLAERLILSVAYGIWSNFRVTFTSKHSAPLVEAHVFLIMIGGPPFDNSGFTREGQEVVRVHNGNLLPGGRDGNSATFPARAFEVTVQQPLAERSGPAGPPRRELVLTKSGALLPGGRITPVMSPVANQWQAPFFYADEHSVFLVRGHEVLWHESTMKRYYQLDSPKHAFGAIPSLLEQPTFVEHVEQGIQPSVPLVNKNFTTIIGDDTQFQFAGSTFDAGGRVAPALRLQGGQ